MSIPHELPGVRSSEEEILGDGYAAAERIALEPNGNPNYLPFGTVSWDKHHFPNYLPMAIPIIMGKSSEN